VNRVEKSERRLEVTTMKWRRLSSILVLAGLALGLLPGGRAHGDSALQQLSAARGGVVRSPSGHLTLAIPPGALEKDTVITVAELPPGEGTALGPTYDLGPAGLQFHRPVTLTLRYEAADIPAGFDPEDVAVTEVNPPAKDRATPTPAASLPASDSPEMDAPPNPWDYLDSAVDAAAGTVSARIEHFSRYAIRSYASYTLGSGEKLLFALNSLKSENSVGLFDLGLTQASAAGTGYASANYHLPTGEFLQKVGTPVGTQGIASALTMLVKWFRVKRGRQGETSTDAGTIAADIEHWAAYSGNRRIISFCVVHYDRQGERIGEASVAGKANKAPGERRPPSQSHGMVGRGIWCESYQADPIGQYFQPYAAGAQAFRIKGCHWEAGQWYAVALSVTTFVAGNPPHTGVAAGGGEVQWLGVQPKGTCHVSTLAVEG
jgi:hypothetical protein